MALVQNDYSSLVGSTGVILDEGRKKAIQSVNQILVQTYWAIGERIVAYEQKGSEKAEYGTALLDNLSNDLKLKHGRGFSKSNVYLMRQFFLKYQKFQTVSGKLSWSHYSELLGLGDDMELAFL